MSRRSVASIQREACADAAVMRAVTVGADAEAVGEARSLYVRIGLQSDMFPQFCCVRAICSLRLTSVRKEE